MGDCKKQMRQSPDVSDMDDSRLLQVMDRHRDPKFWNSMKHLPDTCAYVRRWAMVVRREARQRGLPF